MTESPESTRAAAPPPEDDRYATGERLRTMGGITEIARRNLTDVEWNFLWCGVGDEETVADNTAAFSRHKVNAPLFTGVSNPDTSTTVLGLDLRFPLFTASFGPEGVFHPEGHLAVGRAAAQVGVHQMVPVAASHTLEAVAEASPVASIYQMTMVGDEELALDMIHRAKAAGYRYICATFSPIQQWRERMIEDAFSPAGHTENVNFGPGASDPASLTELLRFTEPRWTWKRMAALAARSPLPILYKGVNSAEDARAAIDAGACALYVSNYGGRGLDRVPATLDVLPEVRAAAGEDMPIILDSGVRRGSDIATAIALGADAVAIGRPVALGLAADGERGVRRVLEILQRELWMTMGHLGCSTVAELGPHVLRTRV